MRVGIICAVSRELDPFLEVLSETKVTEKSMLKFHEGTIEGVEVVALFSGVCKVNAAIATQVLIDNFDVDYVINSGTAGGINPTLQVFDTVISTEIAYHDVASDILTEFHPWMDSVFFKASSELVALSRNIDSKSGRIFWGRMVTGECFVADEGRSQIIDKFDPLTVDMETGSMAHVCYVNKIPFISIRSITDTADHSGSDVFVINCKEASNCSKNVTVELLKLLRNCKNG